MSLPGTSFLSGRAVLTLVVVGWLGIASGCALLPGQEPRGWTVGSDDNGDITLQVYNDNANDARIYLLWNGDRRRLGFVSSKTSETFRTPWRAADLRIEVDFLAGRGFVSDPWPVSPGDRVDFRIPVGR